MSTMRERPNRDALNRGVDIFRDAMRSFVVRHMRRVFGDGAEEAIRSSLNDAGRKAFQRRRRRGEGVEGAIDLNAIPHIVDLYWKDVFGSAFEHDRSSLNLVRVIVDARNESSHPGGKDLSVRYVESRLTDFAEVLGRIGAEEEKREVERIRDNLQPGVPPRQPAPDGSAVGYGVYEEKIYNYARVHRETCTYWQGRKRGPINVHENEWHGPFGSREEAFGRAGETGRDVVGCKVCRP